MNTSTDSAPTIVTMGSYSAKVVNCDGVYILSLSFMDTPLSLLNSFCKDYHMLLCMGRALFTACNDHKEPTEHFGFGFGIGCLTFTGWLTQRGEKPEMIPALYNRASGRECGKVLMELGLEMEKRRKLALWMDELLIGLQKAS